MAPHEWRAPPQVHKTGRQEAGGVCGVQAGCRRTLPLMAPAAPCSVAVSLAVPRPLPAALPCSPVPSAVHAGDVMAKAGPVVAGAAAAAANSAGMSDQMIGLLLALSSSIFIGSSFVIKKRGLRRAGSTGVRAGASLAGSGMRARALGLGRAAWACAAPPRPTHALPTPCRQRRLLLPAGAAVVGGPDHHGSGGGGQLCGLRLCPRHPGHAAGGAQHHHQVR